MKPIEIYEVGPRDGLQAFSHTILLQDKVDLIKALVGAGLIDIEVGSLVHPKLVPSMADSDEVFKKVWHLDACLGLLVPNNKGIERAKKLGATYYNIFFSPMPSFNIANHGKTYQEVVDQYYISLDGIPKENIRVYLSMAFHSNKNEINKAMKDACNLGSTVVLCDTDGTATNEEVYHTIRRAKQHTDNIALHLHKSTKLFQHIATAYEMGVTQFDSSIGGMGGCPFVEGSESNLATEELVKWCNQMHIPCGVSLEDLDPALEIVKKIKAPHQLVLG
jgi:hydroxymethylglutaryl-CoA lyase